MGIRGGRAGGTAAMLSLVGGKDMMRALEQEQIRQEGVRIKHRVNEGTAQFLRKYKPALRRAGMIDLELPRGHAMPLWMELILENLRLRTKTWRVVQLRGKAGGHVYRVQWLGWGKFTLRGRRRP